MKTRAELEKWPRLAQFVIERPCPVEGGESPVVLPCSVFVHFPAAQPPSYAHEICDGAHYRIDRASARAFGCEGTVPWICEHMGRLIE